MFSDYVTAGQQLFSVLLAVTEKDPDGEQIIQILCGFLTDADHMMDIDICIQISFQAL